MKFGVLLIVGLVAGCGPAAQIGYIDVSKQSRDDITESFNVQIFEGSSPHPRIETYYESLHATSCKNKLWDPPPTKGNALQQLRLKALSLGANAIVNVHFDTQGTDALGTNCWKSVTATGDAVLIDKQ